MTEPRLSAYQYRTLYRVALKSIKRAAKAPDGLHRDDAKDMAALLQKTEREWEEAKRDTVEST